MITQSILSTLKANLTTLLRALFSPSLEGRVGVGLCFSTASTQPTYTSSAKHLPNARPTSATHARHSSPMPNACNK